MTAREKGSDINQKGFPITNFPYLSFRLLESDKDIWMDLNQVYNMIRIG